jgi:hypothetical protein
VHASAVEVTDLPTRRQQSSKKMRSLDRKVDGKPARKMLRKYFKKPIMLLTIHERPP